VPAVPGTHLFLNAYRLKPEAAPTFLLFSFTAREFDWFTSAHASWTKVQVGTRL
jgi:hypothetical protein